MANSPRRVRNFWIEIEVDGKKTKVACGPACADGGFKMRILQRSSGAISTAAEIHGYRSGTQLITNCTVTGHMDEISTKTLKYQTHR